MNSKKQRKFRVWDNNLLYEIYQKTLQFSQLIEEQCGAEKDPSQLPDSVVPTYLLYDISVCFNALYLKLEEEELLTAGFPKQSETAH